VPVLDGVGGVGVAQPARAHSGLPGGEPRPGRGGAHEAPGPGLVERPLAPAAREHRRVPVPEHAGLADTAPAARLTTIADAYGGVGARQILRAVPGRARAMFDGHLAAAAAGDPGLARLATPGWRERSFATLAGFVARLPAIDRLLAE
jgi:hypothetical protein